MNNNPLRNIPKLSRIVIHRARSLFDIAGLLNLQPALGPGRVFLKSDSITRWNE